MKGKCRERYLCYCTRDGTYFEILWDRIFRPRVDAVTIGGGSRSAERTARPTFFWSNRDQPQSHMAEWKPFFERGISNFRLEKYEEALDHFNEVRFPYSFFNEGTNTFYSP